MKTLVIGGTGTVGSQIVQELQRNQQPVRVLVTSAEKAALLPEGVEAALGNMDEPATLPKAFEGIDRVFLLNRQSPTEIAQGSYAVAAAKRAGVSKIVYQSIHNVHEGAHIPHFHTKIAIEKAVLWSGLNYTFICPNNFYQNDFWFKDGIAHHGLYTQPFGNVGLNRVDVRDIAEAVVRVLMTDEFDGQRIALAGPEALTGESTARILSEQLGYDVRYAGNNLDVWAAQARQWLPGWMVDDWVHMYRFFQAQGLKASDDELTVLTKVLGRAPRSYADFVQDHATVFSRVAELV
ncbi:NmrA/HSCARG family protein [Larkinella knui]|uniref:NAD-dependent epimerase/dehydratase family protein n=1 Tax=Larkinella knui TaxID=2025310 RepID=A0A3P1CV93_9BACT|nr:NmrA family NAD(P)-binding protein [Larkinella knui]RRB17282.1 NAD-dependent epimerase/dehydratase family protein [Larkinella knui]